MINEHLPSRQAENREAVTAIKQARIHADAAYRSYRTRELVN